VTFNNFSAFTNGCSQRQSAIQRNEFQSDYIPLHKFTRTSFKNVDDAAVVYLADPDPAWANQDDCGTWACTGPNNVVLDFDDTRFYSSSGS